MKKQGNPLFKERVSLCFGRPRTYIYVYTIIPLKRDNSINITCAMY